MDALRCLAGHADDLAIRDFPMRVSPDGSADKNGFAVFAHGWMAIAA
jgi:hypothetical protein